MSGEKRRLAGILAADVVGYSTMVAADEPGTLARVRTLRGEIVEPLAAAHDGRLFKTMGDGFLLEFASAVQALRCAIAIQTALNTQMEGLRLRIGVHQGEVVPEGEDLLGDGVIIAARLEPLAEPGGICISSRVREDAAGKMALEVIDLGEPMLKNISAKIRIYRVRLNEAERPALPLPDKPSLVVLPFQNMSGDPEQQYFADGLVEEITTSLSRVRAFLVIARNSSFTYKGRAVDVKQVGRELGIRYVLEGSVRKAAGRVRISGQLIDATTGAHLWADRFDGALDDVFELQDQVTLGVVGVIEPTILRAEIERAQRKPPENLQAYDLVLRGLPHMRSGSRERVEEAIRLFRRATEIDPTYALAYALLSSCSYLPLLQGWVVPADVDLEEIVRCARIALELGGDDDPEVIALAASRIAAPGGDLNGAIALTEKAVALNPNSIVALNASGRWHAEAGNTKMAIERLERAARLNPLEGNGTRNNNMSIAYFHAGEYETALDFARKALRDSSNFVAPMRRLAVLLALLGRIEEAREVMRRLRAISPAMTISRVRAYFAVESPGRAIMPHIHDAIYEGLRSAGLPE